MKIETFDIIVQSIFSLQIETFFVATVLTWFVSIVAHLLPWLPPIVHFVVPVLSFLVEVLNASKRANRVLYLCVLFVEIQQAFSTARMKLFNPKFLSGQTISFVTCNCQIRIFKFKRSNF
jgi:hypothetical protein